MKKNAVNSITESAKEYPFLKSNVSSSNEPFITKETYKKILLLILEKLAYRLITTGDKIRLPVRLGYFQVVKYKRKRLKHSSIDYAASKKFGKEIRHNNKTTDGYWVRVHWYKFPHQEDIATKIKIGAMFSFQRNYAFKFSRPNQRPNSYNKWNPKVSLYPFFKEKGWLMYKEKTRVI